MGPGFLLLAALLAGATAAGAAAVAWEPPVEIAASRGERGPWRQSQSRYDYVDDPSVALAPGGEAAVVWVDQGLKAVLFQRFDRAGRARFERPVDVSRTPGTFSWLPRIALAPGRPDEVFVLWQEIIFSGGSHGGDILFARSGDGGATFSAPLNLSASRGGDGKGRIDRDTWHNGSLAIAVAGDGIVYAAWTEYDGPLWLARSEDGGRRFTPPRRVAGSGARPARGPALAVAPDGELLLAWTVGEDAAADIHVARSRDRGESFGAPAIVAPSRGYSDAPKLAVDRQGVVHLVYAESAGGPFDAYRIHYTRARDGGAFEAPRGISHPAPAGMASASFPALALDGKGGVYVAWELARRAAERPTALGLAVSHDGGRVFGPAVEVPASRAPAGGANGSHQGQLMRKLAVSDEGDVVLVNSSLVPERASRVWLLRGRVRGGR
jgi:hypothetical protein